MMTADLINAHPLVNTQTTAIRPSDLLQFVRACDHDPHILDLTQIGE